MRYKAAIVASVVGLMAAAPVFAQPQQQKKDQGAQQQHQQDRGRMQEEKGSKKIHLSEDKIKDLQSKLNEKADAKISVDGKFGPKTRDAVREYQKQENLPQTGHADKDTLSRLGVE